MEMRGWVARLRDVVRGCSHLGASDGFMAVVDYCRPVVEKNYILPTVNLTRTISKHVRTLQTTLSLGAVFSYNYSYVRDEDVRDEQSVRRTSGGSYSLALVLGTDSQL